MHRNLVIFILFSLLFLPGGRSPYLLYYDEMPESKGGIFSDLFISPVFAADEETENPEGEGEGEGEGTEGENPCPECQECPDPALVVLTGLEERKKKMDQEEEALKQERKALEKFKEQIDEDLEKLENLKKQIQDDLTRIQKVRSGKELDALAEEQAKEAEIEKKKAHMASVYAKMDPAKAGEILGQMDIKVASDIISRIPERKASKILENVDKAQAAKISERLGNKKP